MYSYPAEYQYPTKNRKNIQQKSCLETFKGVVAVARILSQDITKSVHKRVKSAILSENSVERWMVMENKTVAALLAIFLGALGLHKFYLGRIGWGVTYLLVSLIGSFLIVPPFVAFIAFIEGIVLLDMDPRSFDSQYNA